MKTSFCPVCNSTVTANVRFCQNCGVDLALAATFAEDALASSTASVKLPVTPEVLIPRLGEKLVQREMISEEELQTSLSYQKDQASLGQPLLLGQALIHLGYLDRASLDKVITAQILDLQTALNRSNRDLEKRVQEYTADLQHAMQKLSELNQLKSNFISAISHELRTPLTHVKGYLELLADHSLGPLSSEQDEAMEVMSRATDRLETLINDLIKFSESAKGGISLRLANISVRNLFEKVTSQAHDKAIKREVSLKIKVPDDLPDVIADEENIQWVMAQLVDNAIKFTNPGGNVRVTAGCQGPQVMLAVIDSGIGIPEERLEEIFLPFHQLDNSTSRRYGGTGMGLTLVKRILEAHHSHLQIRSAPNQGSRFQFSLPWRKNELVNRGDK